MPLQLPPQQYNYDDFVRILSELDQRITDLERAFTDQPYILTNITDTRTLDGAAATLNDTRNMLGTLVEDLQKRGRLP